MWQRFWQAMTTPRLQRTAADDLWLYASVVGVLASGIGLYLIVSFWRQLREEEKWVEGLVEEAEKARAGRK